MSSTSLFEALPDMGRDWAIYEYKEYVKKCAKNGIQTKSFVDFVWFVLFEMPEIQEKDGLPY